ncbi:hypothetical protein WN51_11260 [Melipona quadrifasciata]|uniref:Uncharacterized protein n=1 Tax=Melipona quadrifasciata TaxID=166423 RepID=A0A0M9A533_9HYME|nr:hypothetical protein WN51_11260 [Melipona quadrifasciata]
MATLSGHAVDIPEAGVTVCWDWRDTVARNTVAVDGSNWGYQPYSTGRGSLDKEAYSANELVIAREASVSARKNNDYSTWVDLQAKIHVRRGIGSTTVETVLNSDIKMYYNTLVIDCVILPLFIPVLFLILFD